jgi:hypothetical protein
VTLDRDQPPTHFLTVACIKLRQTLQGIADPLDCIEALLRCVSWWSTQKAVGTTRDALEAMPDRPKIPSHLRGGPCKRSMGRTPPGPPPPHLSPCNWQSCRAAAVHAILVRHTAVIKNYAGWRLGLLLPASA